MPPEELDRLFREWVHLLREAGAQIVFISAPWNVIMSAEHPWHEWHRTRLEKMIKLLSENGIEIALQWISCSAIPDDMWGGGVPPSDFKAYTAFAGEWAERYDGDGFNDAPGSPVVHYWSPWTEPDNPDQWRPKPDAAKYAEFQQLFYTAIKKANPKAVVLLAVLGPYGGGYVTQPQTACPFPELCAGNFLQALYDNGAKGSFEAVLIDPYPFCGGCGRPMRDFWKPEGLRELQAEIDLVRQTIRRNGDDVPVIISEIGYPTAATRADIAPTTPDPEGTVADWLKRLYTELRGVETIAWWKAVTHMNVDPKDTMAVFFATSGLFLADGTPTRLFRAYQEAATGRE